MSAEEGTSFPVQVPKVQKQTKEDESKGSSEHDANASVSPEELKKKKELDDLLRRMPDPSPLPFLRPDVDSTGQTGSQRKAKVLLSLGQLSIEEVVNTLDEEILRRYLKTRPDLLPPTLREEDDSSLCAGLLV